MNQELGEFFIQFTTKGLTEVKDAINDLSKKMDEVGNASEKATEKHKGFFGHIGGWVASLGIITTAVWALKKAWDGVAEVSAKTMDLQWSSLYIGTSAETLERWQKVAVRNALNSGDITSSFNSLYKFLYDYSNGQVPGEEFNKKIGLALQGTSGGADIQNAIMRSVNSGNANALLATLNTYLSSGLLGSQAGQSILEAFGINNKTMMGLLSQSNLAWQLSQVPTPQSQQENVVNSAKYELARAKFSEAVEEFWFSIQPEVTRLVTWFTNEGIPAIKEFLDTYWPRIESGVKWLFNWIIEKLGVLIEKFGDEKTKIDWKSIKAGAIGGAIAGGLTGGITGIGAIPGAIVGAGMGAFAGYKNGQKTNNNPQLLYWETLTPEEQFSLFSRDASFDYLNHNQLVPSGTIEANNKAVAIVNIDGHEVVKNESGGLSVLDYTSPINTPYDAR